MSLRSTAKLYIIAGFAISLSFQNCSRKRLDFTDPRVLANTVANVISFDVPSDPELAADVVKKSDDIIQQIEQEEQQEEQANNESPAPEENEQEPTEEVVQNPAPEGTVGQQLPPEESEEEEEEVAQNPIPEGTSGQQQPAPEENEEEIVQNPAPEGTGGQQLPPEEDKKEEQANNNPPSSGGNNNEGGQNPGNPGEPPVLPPVLPDVPEQKIICDQAIEQLRLPEHKRSYVTQGGVILEKFNGINAIIGTAENLVVSIEEEIHGPLYLCGIRVESMKHQSCAQIHLLDGASIGTLTQTNGNAKCAGIADEIIVEKGSSAAVKEASTSSAATTGKGKGK